MIKRKTNLFYTQGYDSKFVTFTNYTEALTGNFLSTDTKLFPSRFLCLHLDYLENENFENIKSQLIKLLSAYYESKLAVLRDNDTDYDNKLKILPLNYLLELLVLTYYDETNENNETPSVGKLKLYDFNNTNDYNKIKTNAENLIVYINDITEQDYNGTYTDTICLIDLHQSKYKDIEINLSGILRKESFTFLNDITEDNLKDTKNILPIPVDPAGNKCLYGWENYYSTDTENNPKIISEYYDVKSIFDEEINNNGNLEYKYYVDSFINKINFYGKQNELQSLKFNVIIPLFDIVDTNYKDAFVNVVTDFNSELENNNGVINLEYDKIYNNLYRKNIPLGIWFSEKPIELYKDKETGFSQTWSLTLSSQFKPFGYSKSIPNEVSDTSKSNSFATFAQVLVKQNEITNKFLKLENEYNNLSGQITGVQNQIATIMPSVPSVDNLTIDLYNFKNEIREEFNVFKQEILDIISNLKWQSTI